MLACEGSGEASEPQHQLEEARTGLTSHKVQLSAEQVLLLEQRGANIQVIGDYGSFKLVQADERALAMLPEGVEIRDEYSQILLNAGTIDTLSEHGRSLRGMRLQARGKRFHLVQFHGPIKPEWHRELEATGVQIVSYIPNNAYLVYGDVAALTQLQRYSEATAVVQWNGDYLDDYKLNPSVHTANSETYEVQLIKDEEANGETLELIRRLQSRSGTIQEALGYVNVNAYLRVQDLYQIATRPDVLSIQPRPMPRKFDERQNMIVSGNLSGTLPNGPGWLAWLTAKGFTQAQFTASGFGVDVSDSGLDNGTLQPNHFGLYAGGDVTGNSRVAYARLEGTANAGSTIQGCDGHGNINAHIIGGYSNLTGTPFADSAGFRYGLGVAPFVKVGSSVVFDPSTFTSPSYENLQSRAYRDGMRISSNSWGANTNTYNSDAQRYDALTRDAQPATAAVPAVGNQEMVIVFAAGNSGPSANTVGSPGTAKNIITAGASENVQAFGGPDQCNVADTGADSAMDIINFSSRGPAADGRKKPDLVAPGTHVSGGVAQAAGQRGNPPANPLGQALSCFNAEGVCAGPGTSNFFPLGQQWYTASSGTSHSTPAIAGGAALVRQYFINQGVAPPSAAMTKAYLMNSARYMTGVGANDNLWSNNQGMGLMDLGMAFDGTSRTLDDQNPANLFTATGQSRTFDVSAGDPTKPFRVTLAWTDAPGSTTGNAWKNNLDLTVTGGGNTYKGNVFTGANSVTGGNADLSNNVESVFLPAGTPGPFTITVTAANINSDGVPGNSSALDQDFALVAYNTCGTTPGTLSDVTATASGANRITVAWANNDATQYNVYRATSAGGPYTQIGQAARSPYEDTTVSGGITYFYVVRGRICVEAPASNEASVTATGACTLPPTFAGVASVTNDAAATCGTTATWSAGTPACGGTLTYSVYRSTTAGFTPSGANRIATGLTGTSFADDLNLVSGTRYYYVVRATETAAATVEETNTVQRSAAPTSAAMPGLSYFDDFDANRPPNATSYWIPSTLSGTSGAINIVSNCRYQSATRAYRYGATNTSCGGTYPASTSAILSLGGNGASGINGFAIPGSALSAQMTFNIGYVMEARFDGAWLLYSTESATGPWTQVPDSVSTTQPYISAGGYDNTLSTNSAIRIWTGPNGGVNGALKAVSVNLNALAGRTVWFGFRFSNDAIVHQEGFYVDDVRITSDAYGACATRTPPPGPAVSYQVTGLPATSPAGEVATFTVTALDAVGQTATDYSGSASFTSTDPQAVLPPNTPFTAGVASNVSISFRTLGTRSVTATDTATPSITGSASTTVTAGPAAALVFTVQPGNTVAGASISPAVKVGLVDQFGNPVSTGTQSVTLALGNNPGGSTLSGTTTATMVAGVATFSNLSLNKTGQGYTLTAVSPGLMDATSAGFQITPAAAAKLAFLTQPSNSTAGIAITPAVQVSLLDAFDNATAATANVTVGLGSNAAGGTLAGTTTVAAVNGVATFGNLSIARAGTGYTLAASGTALTGTSSSAFDITPNVPYRVTLTQQPTNVTAGAIITPPVQARLYDQYGNAVTQATTAVSASLSNNPAGGTLRGTTTVNAVDGVATFDNLSVDRAGPSYTLTVGASGLYTDTSVGFDVNVGAPAQLAFTASPTGNVTSGTAFTAQVAVRDAGGNLVTGTPTQVTLSLTNAPGATLSGTATATTVNGVASFPGLSIDRAGSGYTLQATATGLTSATSPTFGVVPGAAASLSFLTQPANGTAGAALTPAVRVAVMDAQGNQVTSFNSLIAVSLAAHPSGGTLSGTRTAPVIGGVATFSELSINRAAQGYQLVAQGSGLPNVTSTAFDISAGQKTALVFSVQPGTTQAGVAISPAVRVSIQDAYGNVDTTATDAVTVALGNNPRNATLSGALTVNAINGVATFSDLSINRNGQGYTLRASASALTSAASTSFDVTPGRAQRLVFRTTASQVAAGEALPTVEVELRDELDNLYTDSTAIVMLSLGENATAAQLLGTATARADNGVAKFTGLSLRKVGNGYTLVATAQDFAGATSTAFTVNPGAAASYTLSLASSVAAGQEATLSAKAFDAYGNLAANYGGSVRVTSSDTTASFAANATFAEGVLQAFKVTFKSPGQRTITLTDTERASLTSTVQLHVAPFAQPTVAVTNPAGGAIVSGQVSISASGAVAPGTTLAQISILVDGVVIASGTEETLTGTWDSSQVDGETSHTLTAVIIDGAGNVATSAPVTITTASSGCGCGATSGTDASIYLGLLILARYMLRRRRQAQAA
jgi:MYXO-CTERM domain-containing protein